MKGDWVVYEHMGLPRVWTDEHGNGSCIHNAPGYEHCPECIALANMIRREDAMRETIAANTEVMGKLLDVLRQW